MPAAKPKQITRAYEAEIVDVKPGERTVVARINTNAVDRYKTMIDPLGIDLRGYRANPVVLWEHGFDPARGPRPIGKCEGMRQSAKELVAKTVFHDDEFSRGIFELYQAEALRAFSVNIVPDWNQARKPTTDECKARPELVECNLVFTRSDLAEYSCVSVPGNAEALATAVARGLWVPETVRSRLAFRRLAVGECRACMVQEKRGGKCHVTSRDGEHCYTRNPVSREAADVLMSAIHDFEDEHDPNEEPDDKAKSDDKRSLPALPPLAGRTMASLEQAVLASLKGQVSEIRRSLVADAADLARGAV